MKKLLHFEKRIKAVKKEDKQLVLLDGKSDRIDYTWRAYGKSKHA